MTKDENYSIVDGVLYVAAPPLKGPVPCEGCVAFLGPDASFCVELGPCTHIDRKDGRAVIWVRAETTPCTTNGDTPVIQAEGRSDDSCDKDIPGRLHRPQGRQTDEGQPARTQD